MENTSAQASSGIGREVVVVVVGEASFTFPSCGASGKILFQTVKAPAQIPLHQKPEGPFLLAVAGVQIPLRPQVFTTPHQPRHPGSGGLRSRGLKLACAMAQVQRQLCVTCAGVLAPPSQDRNQEEWATQFGRKVY